VVGLFALDFEVDVELVELNELRHRRHLRRAGLWSVGRCRQLMPPKIPYRSQNEPGRRLLDAPFRRGRDALRSRASAEALTRPTTIGSAS